MASLLPVAWMTGGDPYFPVILLPDGVSGPADCNSQDVSTWTGTTQWYLSFGWENDIGTVGRECGADGTTYWLGGVRSQNFCKR